jgi:hypothetical protein
MVEPAQGLERWFFLHLFLLSEENNLLSGKI